MSGDTIKSAARMVQHKLLNQPRTERGRLGHLPLSDPAAKTLPLRVSGAVWLAGGLGNRRQCRSSMMARQTLPRSRQDVTDNHFTNPRFIWNSTKNSRRFSLCNTQDFVYCVLVDSNSPSLRGGVDG